MPPTNANEDLLTLSGLGGLYNGEVFALRPGESGTLGATSLATFPVTLCRNYRRLEDDPSREEILTRLAPEHVRFLYVGDGRLVVENLPGSDVRVGRRVVRESFEVDLGEGPVEIEFGYGERVVASVPGSPPDFQEFADPRDEAAEVEGVFMALLSPEGPLAGLAGRESPGYELVEEEEESADPAADTGPIPPVEAPRPGRKAKRRWFRGGSGIFFSLLVHLVIVLGLFAWMTSRPPPEEPPRTALVSLASDASPAKAPKEPPPEPVRPAEVAAEPVAAEPSVEESESGPVHPSRPGDDLGAAGAGGPGPIGIGGAGLPGGPGATGPVFAAGSGGGRGGAAFRRRDLDLALGWLARHQRADGGWGAITSLAACRRCTGPGKREYPVAMTGFALAAFAGAGHTHRTGDHREVVRKGIRWLSTRQREGGSFQPGDAPEEARPLYGDAIATFALAGIYRQTKSPLVRSVLVRAAGHIVATQEPYAGWRYRPGMRESDTSVTGWATLALLATERAGIPVNPVYRFGALTWVEDATDPVSFRVGYRERGRGSPGMTATGLAIRLLAGREPREEAVRKGMRHLEAELPAWPEKDFATEPAKAPDLLGFYFGALATGRYSDEDSRDWSEATRDALRPHQERSGEMRGSFPPTGRWTRFGGRVFATGLAALILTVVLDSPQAFR